MIIIPFAGFCCFFVVFIFFSLKNVGLLLRLLGKSTKMTFSLERSQLFNRSFFPNLHNYVGVWRIVWSYKTPIIFFLYVIISEIRAFELLVGTFSPHFSGVTTISRVIVDYSVPIICHVFLSFCHRLFGSVKFSNSSWHDQRVFAAPKSASLSERILMLQRSVSLFFFSLT